MRGICCRLALIGWFVALPAQAAVGHTWQDAAPVRFHGSEAVTYGQLATQNQAAMYVMTIDEPTVIRLELGVPRHAPAEFSPRVVVYQPDSMTLGPALPMEQPPLTLATVYPAVGTDTTFSILTQVSYRLALNTTVQLNQPGTYYLGVYNPSIWSGKYRLEIDQGAVGVANWSDAWMLPARWWSDQAFAGWSWRTILTPLLVVGLAILVIEQLRFYHLHHLAVKSRPALKRKTQSKKSASSRRTTA